MYFYALVRALWSLRKSLPTTRVRRLKPSGMVFCLATSSGVPSLSILMDSGRIKVHAFILEEALKDGRTAVASFLQDDDRIRPTIRKCATCKENIGLYECCAVMGCSGYPDMTSFVDQGDANWSNRQHRLTPAHCRSCVLATSRCCRACLAYKCSDCDNRDSPLFRPCSCCKQVVCRACVHSCYQYKKTQCKSCEEEENGWGTRYYSAYNAHLPFCSGCNTKTENVL